MPKYVEDALKTRSTMAQFDPYYLRTGTYNGTYLKQGLGHFECNKRLSADFVWRYCNTAKARWEPLPNVAEAWNLRIPFASLVEFVQTMSQATQHAAAAFW